ncbi:anti-sigma factor antagonist [Actinoplanes sp. NPDC026623]|uniref:anti-sigma factor antagonist n=1 Tax=Actinoplanes sp. NPDC026623 TaxID=3155610 RepID=UPI0033CC2F69
MKIRERHILIERYYGNRTQTQIAADLGISQMHVSRLITATLDRLRTAMLTDETPTWPSHHPARTDTNPTITTDREPTGTTRILITGEIDRDNTDHLRQTLLDRIRRTPTTNRLVIDLTDVPAIDTAGLAALVRTHDAAQARGIELTITGMQPYVRHLVTLTGLGTLLPTTSPRTTVDAAGGPTSARRTAPSHPGQPPRRSTVHHVPRGREPRSAR